MRIARWTLLLLLAFTALIQVGEGIASITRPAAMMAGLQLVMSPDAEVPITFLGLAMLIRGAVTVIALVWLMKRKAEGLFLARFIALTILLSAPVVYFRLHRSDLASGDLIQGLLLLLPALVLKHASGIEQ